MRLVIEHEIRAITQEEPHPVFDSMHRRINLYLENDGSHIQHLL